VESAGFIIAFGSVDPTETRSQKYWYVLYYFVCSSHPVQVMEVFVDPNEKLNIVMEYCETDFEKIITNQGEFFYGYRFSVLYVNSD
jgi:hypothetical protein